MSSITREEIRQLVKIIESYPGDRSDFGKIPWIVAPLLSTTFVRKHGACMNVTALASTTVTMGKKIGMVDGHFTRAIVAASRLTPADLDQSCFYDPVILSCLTQNTAIDRDTYRAIKSRFPDIAINAYVEHIEGVYTSQLKECDIYPHRLPPPWFCTMPMTASTMRAYVRNSYVLPNDMRDYMIKIRGMSEYDFWEACVMRKTLESVAREVGRQHERDRRVITAVSYAIALALKPDTQLATAIAHRLHDRIGEPGGYDYHRGLLGISAD